MIHLYIVLSVLLAAFFDWLRIQAVKGEWVNVPKWVTYLIAIVLNGVVFWICGFREWYFVIPEMIFVRATLYDPTLNLMRGEKWNYVSMHTNSYLDQLERRIGLHFTAQRVCYGFISLVLILLYELR
jgi:hypothetical protein